jgi:transposase InsO family protein
VNDQQIKVHGVASITVTFGQVTFDQEFLIVDGINEHCIIGMNAIRKQGFVIDGLTGKVFIRQKDEQVGHLVASQTVCVPPKSVKSIPCRLATDNASTDAFLLFEPSLELPNNVTLESTLFSSGGGTHVLCINGSDQPVQLCRRTCLGPVVCGVEDVNLGSTEQRPKGNANILKEFCFDGVEQEHQKELKKLILEYSDIFATSSMDLGKLDTVKHEIKVQKHPPIKQRPYRVPYSLKETMAKQVSEMIEAGVIIPSKSPWTSPVVLVKKKSGDMRFCVDYRKLNAITTKDCYPLPRIDEILDSLQGKKYFTGLDLANGYWQIEVDPKDREKTAFVVENDLYEFVKMPFGLCNSPSTFMRAMNCVMAGLINEILHVFLDDLIVASSTFKEHIENLRKVFDRLRTVGLKLKPKKCHFLQKKLEFLGHVVSEDGISPDESKTNKIRDFPTPKNGKEVKSFLGLSGYYRKFIKDYSTISHPLTELTKDEVPFRWTEKEQEAFDYLRTCLITRPILAYPNFKLPFIIFTDASNVGLGAVLSQIQDGKERVIAYASRHLNQAERNYATIEKEALAIVFAVKKFKPYIHGHETKIVTDHAPLKWLMKVKNTNAKLARWALEIQDLNLDIEYRPGKTNSNADCLSRIPVSAVSTETPPDLTVLQTKDKFCRELFDYLDKKILPTEGSELCKLNIEEFFIDEDGLLKRECPPSKKRRRYLKTIQLVVPQELKLTIMKALHNDLTAGHLAFQRTYDRVTEKFFWLNMRNEIKDYCAACHECALGKTSPHFKKAPLKPLPVPSEPFERVSMDIVGPLKSTRNGNLYILVLIDNLTKWPEAFAIPNQTAETVAKIFVEQIICRHGMPKTLLTDRGTNFLSRLFQEICKLLRIDRLLTTSYKPSTNGLCEHENKSLKDMLLHFVNNRHDDWDDYLPFVLFAYRTSVHSSTHETPFYLMHGRDATLPLEMLLKLNRKSDCEPNDYRTKITVKLRDAFQLAFSNMHAAQEAQKYQYDKRSNLQKFNVGDKVYMTTVVVQPQQSRKFTPKWQGPYRITQKISDLLYEVNTGKVGKEQIVHVNRLKPCYESQLWKEIAEKTNVGSVDPNELPIPVVPMIPTTTTQCEDNSTRQQRRVQFALPAPVSVPEISLAEVPAENSPNIRIRQNEREGEHPTEITEGETSNDEDTRIANEHQQEQQQPTATTINPRREGLRDRSKIHPKRCHCCN